MLLHRRSKLTDSRSNDCSNAASAISPRAANCSCRCVPLAACSALFARSCALAASASAALVWLQRRVSPRFFSLGAALGFGFGLLHWRGFATLLHDNQAGFYYLRFHHIGYFRWGSTTPVATPKNSQRVATAAAMWWSHVHKQRQCKRQTVITNKSTALAAYLLWWISD